MAVLEFDFKLTEEVSYASKGDFKKTDHLLLKAPKVRQMPLVSALKEVITKSFVAQTYKASADPQGAIDAQEAVITGDALMVVIMGSGSAEEHFYNDFCRIFEKLMLTGVCTLDGEVKMNENTFSEISIDDLESLMGEYTLNFLLPKEIRKEMVKN